MTIDYDIRAEIVDIRSDTPKKDDVFFVDTNVWFWMTYASASAASNPPKPYQITDYPKYVNAALDVGAEVCHSGLSMAELANLIEKTEYDIYRGFVNSQIFPKEYRHNEKSERERIAKEFLAAWA